MRSVVVGVGVILAAGSLVGCANGPAKAPAPANGSSERAFSGPYAEEFRSAYSQAGSELQRRILADSIITSQEAAEARAGLEKCLDGNGYTIAFDDRGGFSVGSRDGKYADDFQTRMNPILEACEQKHDRDVSILHRRSVVNPANEDDRVAVVKCLRRHGLVPKGYTVTDFDRDNDDYSFPFSEFDADGRACLDDPLGLWAKHR
jgi:hypothetical protein